MTGGAIMGGTTAAIRRTTCADKPIRSFEGKGGHFFLKILFFTLGAADGFGGPEDNGFKILPAIQAGIFINGHNTFSSLFTIC
jgi:hypothetical protein